MKKCWCDCHILKHTNLITKPEVEILNFSQTKGSIFKISTSGLVIWFFCLRISQSHQHLLIISYLYVYIESLPNVCPKYVKRMVKVWSKYMVKVFPKYDKTMPKVKNRKLTMHHLRRVFLWLCKVRGILRVGRLVSFDWVSIKKQNKQLDYCFINIKINF